MFENLMLTSFSTFPLISSCSCPDGWFGVRCQEDSPACTVGKHKCARGAQCATRENGTSYCLCPFGKAGRLCDQSEETIDRES